MAFIEACPISAAPATCTAPRKMAGRESGPAKKKVITFRGEHRPAKWEENTERIFFFWTDFGPDTTNDFLKI
ncbi:hypothetical protein FJ934_18100 [Mesorhizobium sp. B2-4-12]|uniref:hypothetical protein n=1 Tax=Mesorhizobium sp. B2-4-12 TaxID=2589937 RepID=UPI00112C20EA|nr:hypothetical protein [Mesorhizobium sp. B2-4-12]TPK93438.1 hypothetical protein FJ934_18100 [Mesorhizobium sp. B2-4-12]